MKRLAKIIHQVLLKKGIDPKSVDRVRIKPVLRGAQLKHVAKHPESSDIAATRASTPTLRATLRSNQVRSLHSGLPPSAPGTPEAFYSFIQVSRADTRHGTPDQYLEMSLFNTIIE